ncbi:MAG: hypothetical protein ACOYM3_33945, partial [Terrimicrobiaceae bacterium]
MQVIFKNNFLLTDSGASRSLPTVRHIVSVSIRVPSAGHTDSLRYFLGILSAQCSLQSGDLI